MFERTETITQCELRIAYLEGMKLIFERQQELPSNSDELEEEIEDVRFTLRSVKRDLRVLKNEECDSARLDVIMEVFKLCQNDKNEDVDPIVSVVREIFEEREA